jgi:hypothetical protein
MLVVFPQQPGLQLQNSCWLTESSRRPLPLHPCSSCGSSVFQPPRHRQHEAVACQNSMSSVDLKYMATSAQSLESSMSTAECKVSTLLSCLFVRNSGSYVAIKEAWKEWNPTKNILNPANIGSGTGEGL